MAFMWDLEDLMAPSDIAELCQVSLPVVSNWAKRRTRDFPNPVWVFRHGPVYSRKAILTWLDTGLATQEATLLAQRQRLDEQLRAIRNRKAKK